MTRKEAIEVLKSMKSEESYNALIDLCNMAIESLQTDLVWCKDCRYWYKKMNKCNRCPSISGNWGADDFCSYGERKEP